MAIPDSYIAMAMQLTCHSINAAPSKAAARQAMLDTIARIKTQITGTKRFVGSDVRLVVLPEYFLTGFPMGQSAGQWADLAGIDMDGAEYAALGDVARAADIYLAGNAYERDPNFPGIYFQTSFLIAPAGDVILRYRRLISMFAPSPYDVLDRYLSVYGKDALFPVADTEIGRIAAIASEEILYPEIARLHAIRGAEVFVHSSSETASALPTAKHIAKTARATENLAYVVSANSAGIAGIAIPESSTDGASKIIDYRGLVLAEAAYGESVAANATIDIAGLRKFCRRPAMANTLARLPVRLFADAYGDIDIHPQGSLTAPDGSIVGPSGNFYHDRQKQVIDSLADRGII